MKKILLFSIFLALSSGGFWLWRDISLKSEARQKIEFKNKIEEARRAAYVAETSRLVEELMSGVGLKEEWASALEAIKNLSETNRAKFALLAKGKLFEAMFYEAEGLLFRARLILTENKNNPVGQRYKAEAGVLYSKMSELEQELKETGNDPEWDSRLNYLLGLYHFRSIFFAKENEAANLVAKSAGRFAKVFLYLPKHRDAEVALEILQKTTEGSNGDSSLKNKLQLLPRDDPGFVITGRSRGKH